MRLKIALYPKCCCKNRTPSMPGPRTDTPGCHGKPALSYPLSFSSGFSQPPAIRGVIPIAEVGAARGPCSRGPPGPVPGPSTCPAAAHHLNPQDRAGTQTTEYLSGDFGDPHLPLLPYPCYAASPLVDSQVSKAGYPTLGSCPSPQAGAFHQLRIGWGNLAT